MQALQHRILTSQTYQKTTTIRGGGDRHPSNRGQTHNPWIKVTPAKKSAAKSIITMERDEKRYFRSAPPAPHENSVFRRLRRAVLSSTKTLSKNA